MKNTSNWLLVAVLAVAGIGLKVSVKWFVAQQATQFRQVLEAPSVPIGPVTQSPGIGTQEFTP